MLLSQGLSCGVTSYVHAHLSCRLLPDLSEISLRSIFKGPESPPLFNRHLWGTRLVLGTLVSAADTVKIKGNQSDTISIKLPNEVTTSEVAGNQSELILTFIVAHNPSETVDS